MKTVVVFQGGGALGAFGAGAWQALVEEPGFDEAPLSAVAGASIGALNAAAVARHHLAADRGAAALLPPLLERLLRNGRLGPDKSVRLVTVEQFARVLEAPPRSGAEIAYRVLNLLQVGKLDPPVIDGLRIGRLQRIVRTPLAEDGVSGQFDYSPRRIDRLIDEGRAAAQAAAEASLARQAA